MHPIEKAAYDARMDHFLPRRDPLELVRRQFEEERISRADAYRKRAETEEETRRREEELRQHKEKHCGRPL